MSTGTGSGTLPSLILLHGIGTNRCTWDALRASLPEGGRSVAVDLPGHGTRARESFDLVRAMRVVDHALSDQGGPAILVGWSLGGYVALAYGCERPDDVAGIVLIGSSLVPSTAMRTLFIAASLAAPLADASPVRHLIAAVARRRYGRRATTSTLRCGIQPGNGLRSLRSIARRDIGTWLDRVQCPVQLINGADDRLFRMQEKAILRRLPHATGITIQGAGHLAPVTAPEALARLIGGFCRQSSSSSGSMPDGSIGSAPEDVGSSG